MSFRNNQFAVLYQFLHLQPPASFESWNWNIQSREFITKSVVNARTVMHVNFFRRNAIHVYTAIDQPYPITGYSYHAFHKMLSGIYGITENDNIPAPHPPVRHDRVPEPAAAVPQFVYQQVVANQQRVLHGLRRYLKSLHDECNDKDGDHHS